MAIIIGTGANETIDTVLSTGTLGETTAVSDTVNAGNGNDAVSGGDGSDDLFGEGGDDDLFGGNGDDSLVGGSGDDDLFGDAGRDTLVGGSGSDLMFGDAGNDLLFGGTGNDSLVGGDGNDRMNGGTGRDTFFFGAESAQDSDTILDYDPTVDSIDLTGLVFSENQLTLRNIGRGDFELALRTNGLEIEIETNRFFTRDAILDSLVF